MPAGVATAQRSKTLTKWANGPRAELVAMGSAATSSMVKCLGAVGTMRMSMSSRKIFSTRRMYLFKVWYQRWVFGRGD